jgi:hypothetical protein
MKGSNGAIRSVLSCAWVVALLGLALPPSVLADQPTTIDVGKWVRVTTAPEVAGEGFAMGRETRGTSLSEDKRTRTFDVNGRPVRVAKPTTTLEGAVEAVDETTLILGGSSGGPPIAIPRPAITGLDLRRRESKKGTGLLIGALAGGAIGYEIGAATSGPLHSR